MNIIIVLRVYYSPWAMDSCNSIACGPRIIKSKPLTFE